MDSVAAKVDEQPVPDAEVSTPEAREAIETILQKAWGEASGGPETAGPDDTAPGLDEYKSIGAENAQGAGTISYETKDGKSVLVSQSVNPEMYDQVVNDGQTLSAIGSSEIEGYDLAGSDQSPPAFSDYKAIGPADEVGPGLIRYETQSGDKVIVSQATNPELYDNAKNAYNTLGTINEAGDNGYGLAGADAKVPGDISLDTVKDLGNGVMQYDTASGEKVAVSKDMTPELYDQVTKLGDQKDGIGKLQGAGYALAESGAEAPKLTEYKGIRPPGEMGDGIIGYTDTSGNKVVVSQANNPELYDQVSADYDKTMAISQSKKDGYVLANDQYSQAPAFQVVGSPDEFGNGIIRFETQSGDKYVVSQDINPQLYDDAVKAYNDFSGNG